VVGNAERLIGRDAERRAITALLDHARESRSGVLVLRGDAGVGKSALLDLAADAAAGMRVLRVAGVEQESELTFAALHQLLRPVASHVDRIPDVQGQALRIALGLDAGIAENRFIIGLAVLSLLGEVANDGPILCLIDDAQWLDQPSANALAFVARRLEAEGIVMLFSIREGDAGSFARARLPERTVRGLSPDDGERVLVERFGDGIAPEVRRMIVEAAQGLPLALLEIPAALTDDELAGHHALPQPMPVGHKLEEILLERVRRLPALTQLLLLVAAAEGTGEAAIVFSAAARLGVPATALVDAEASRLIRSQGSALVFRHPLLRSAIYRGASLPQRQMAHGALAEILGGEDEEDRRVWHRAALVLYPDDNIADELERTADRARSRSGYAAAAGALRRAAELTTSNERRSRRLVAAARDAWDAGMRDEATVLLRTAGSEPDDVTYARLCHIEGEIEFRCGNPLDGARVLLDGAHRIARIDPHNALRMLFDAALCANYAGDLGLMIGAGRRASELEIDASDPDAPYVDLLAGAVAMLEAKDLSHVPRLRRALDRVGEPTEPRWLVWAGAVAAGLGDEARDDALRRRAETLARSSIAVGDLAMALERIADADLMHDRVAQAWLHSEDGVQLAVETGLTNSMCWHRAVLAWVAAIRGDRETCVGFADRAAEIAQLHGLAPHNSVAHWAVGLLHLGLGEFEDAATKLETLATTPPGATHPYIVVPRVLPDLVEAAVRADRPEVAGSAAAQLADFAGDGAPDWALALATRCTALVTSAPEAREKLLKEALVFHERDRRPFQRARTLLLLGEYLRRERRRSEAREHLRMALGSFEQLGARPWADRARRELRATGQTVRRRVDTAPTQLTLQEQQVAALVAEGATNKEVAAQLFLSPRTVEYHLRNVFSKLAISSRAELVRLRLAGEPTDGNGA
jgi:DNA-binding CsgD family transcriptional regulator